VSVRGSHTKHPASLRALPNTRAVQNGLCTCVYVHALLFVYVCIRACVTVCVRVYTCMRYCLCTCVYVHALLCIQNPELPADVFTACLTTPIKVALRWFCSRSLLRHDGITKDLIDQIPGRQVRLSEFVQYSHAQRSFQRCRTEKS